MKYDLSNKDESAQLHFELARMLIRKPLVELKEVRPTRSLNQNAYLHLLIGAFGDHFGYTMEEAKQIYKDLNSSSYRYTKKGRHFYRSSAELNKEEMTATIEKFRQKAAENGCYLPDAENTDALRQIENAIEKNKFL